MVLHIGNRDNNVGYKQLLLLPQLVLQRENRDKSQLQTTVSSASASAS
jgi:hypothetical protein